MALQHLRSNTANKRPDPTAMADGQLAINTPAVSPGLFFKDAAGVLVKVGPVHVGTTAPNASPASGGTAGNSVGEQWLDTTGGTYVFKVWDGSAWRSESGTFVDVNGDVMTGALGIIAGSAAAPGLYFSGDSNTGIYSPGADQVAISTSGAGRLFVTSTGQVLTGTASTTADSTLILQGNATNSAGAGALQLNRGTISTAITSGSQLGVLRFSSSDDKQGGGIAAITDGTWSSTSYPTTFTVSTVPSGSTASSERLRITSAGLVGVGTSVPVATNHLRGSGTSGQVTASWMLENASSGTVGMDVTGAAGSSIWRFLYGGGPSTGTNALTPALTIGVEGSAAGRVAIGTTSAVAPLTVSNGTVNLVLSPFSTEGYIGTATNHAVPFIINNTERARLTTNGQLLVGTSTSTGNIREGQLFSVTAQNSGYGGMSLGCYNSGSVAPIFDFNTSASSSSGNYTAVANNRPLGYIVFRGSDGSQFVESATIKAEVDGTPGANDMPGRLVFSTTADGASSPTERMRIDNEGNIFWGPLSGGNYPNYLVADGSIRSTKTYNTTTASAANTFISSNGTLARSTSSIKYKTNVETIEDQYADAILGCRPVWYQSTSEADNPEWGHWGFIAEEVVQIDPRLCFFKEEEDGTLEPEGVQYDRFVPHLLNLIKRQQQAIETLEAKVAALETA